MSWLSSTYGGRVAPGGPRRRPAGDRSAIRSADQDLRVTGYHASSAGPPRRPGTVQRDLRGLSRGRAGRCHRGHGGSACARRGRRRGGQDRRNPAQAAHRLRTAPAPGRQRRPGHGRLSPAPIDGIEFAGGMGADRASVLGEGRMLPDFELGVNGLAAGESKTVAVTFPADYQSKDLAGKTASFAITLKKVEAAKLPDVDSDFARGLGVADGDLAKMRSEVKANAEREVKKPARRRPESEGHAGVARHRARGPAEVARRQVRPSGSSPVRVPICRPAGVKMENVPIDREALREPGKTAGRARIDRRGGGQAIRPGCPAGAGETAGRGACAIAMSSRPRW